MNKLVKDALVLTLIAVVAGIALGGVYEVTKNPIAEANEAAQQAAYRSLFEEADSFAEDEVFDAEDTTAKAGAMLAKNAVNKFAEGDLNILSCVNAFDKNDTILGKIYTITSNKGYGGKITLSVGVSEDGTVTGYKITDIAETPGLGMKSTEEKFSSQFEDRDVTIIYVNKNTPGPDEIQAISGATITSRAVTNAVNAAICCYHLANGTEVE